MLPFVAAPEWQTRLLLLNPNPVTAEVTLRAYGPDGVSVDAPIENLAPNGRFSGMVHQLFPQIDGGGQIIARSPVALRGFMDTRGEGAGFALPGSNVLYDVLHVPHIAESEQFWTLGQVACARDIPPLVKFTGGDKVDRDVNLPFGFSSSQLNFKADFFNGEPIPGGAGWGRFTNQRGKSLHGAEIFGQSGELMTAAGLALSDSAATSLIMPHLPQDTSVWWTGVVLVNPCGELAVVTGRAFDGQGKVVAEQVFSLEPGTKRADLPPGFFPQQDLSGAQWLRFEADQALVGYLLFGTSNGDGALAGLEAHSQGTTEQYLPLVFPAEGPAWSGIGLLNPGEDTANISLTLYDDNGLVLSKAEPFSMAARSKRVGAPQEFFPNGAAGWVRVNSDVGLIAFELYGESGEYVLVSGLNALR